MYACRMDTDLDQRESEKGGGFHFPLPALLTSADHPSPHQTVGTSSAQRRLRSSNPKTI
jgi:hypothetical protein